MTSHPDAPHGEVVDPDATPTMTPGATLGGEPGASAASADADDDETVDELADEIDSELATMAAERDSLRDTAQRVAAEFENYRRRTQAQIRDEADRATGRLAEAMLPVLDAAEAAYVRHPDEIGPLLNLMLGELRKHGLETLDLEGKAFDPSLAEAVAHEPGDGGETVVAEVLRSGYRWKDRTLRAAMVRTVDRDAGDDSPPTNGG